MDPSEPDAHEERIPLMQRLYDNIWLLLVVGMTVMLVVYTGWGIWEVISMPQATLP